jgi:[acyl-carrier-protein] S-malonyltransferase
MPAYAFTFPGQGSQTVGMGRDLAAAFAGAREVFDEVDDTLKQKLSKLMFEGPGDQLMLTENAQPALMAMSMAVARVLEQEGGVRVAERAAVVAGHSLGEYSALAAVGALGLADVARLLRLRGRAMQDAVAPGDGAMAALLGVELETAAGICADAALRHIEGQADTMQVVQVANDNGGGQVVISGEREAVERAIELARARGVKRAMLLPVSAPFHSSLMAPAAAVMERALAESVWHPPAVPLISNVTAGKLTDPARITAALVEGVTARVRWRESMLACTAMGVTCFIELGAGKVLTGLIKRIAPEAAAFNAGTPGEIESLLKAL